MNSYLSKFFDVTLCSIGRSGDFGLCLSTNPRYTIRRGISFIAYLRKFDAVISFSLLPNLISALVSRYSILSLTGSPFFTLDNSLLARIYWTFVLQPISCLFADAIVPTSPSVIPPYIDIFPSLRSKVHSIYGFIDTHRIDKCLDSVSLDSIDLNFPYILFLANLSRQKGILELIKIFALIKHADPSLDTKLIVCGNGPMLDRCLAQCTALGLQVPFPHQSLVDPFDVFFATKPQSPYHFIANSRVVVCPYYYEGLSNTMLESLYLKKPVLAAYNRSTAYLQELLLRNSPDDSLPAESPLYLLPFPSKKNYHHWASALKDLADKPFAPARQCIDNSLELSASINVLKWKALIDSIH